MARRNRDEAAATLAAKEFDALPPRGVVLVLEDPSPLVAEAALGHGAEVLEWSRRRADAEAWPPEVLVDVVALRLPRAREEFEMLLHVAASRLRPGGRLLVYGANDEGIKSADKRVAPLFESVATLATGGHARLLGAVRGGPPAPVLRSTREAWRTVDELEVPWSAPSSAGVQADEAAAPTPAASVVPWVSYPGVFAHQRLDGGTALLLENLPVAELSAGPGVRVLDWGGGSGFLAAGVLAAAPEAQVTMVEIDGLALAAARENVPRAEARHGDGWEAVADAAPFDVVVANPPYHRGKEESIAEVLRLFAGVETGMAPKGTMRIVVQRRLRVEGALEHTFRRVRVVADRGEYRIWEGRR